VAAQEADNQDIWLHDIERGTRTRMTFGAEGDYHATWANGGADVLFNNGAGQNNTIYIRPADGTHDPEVLVNGYFPHVPDGQEFMIYNRFLPGTGDDIFYREIDGSGDGEVFLQTRAAELGPQLSPDGRFVIYMSNESGMNEVYLTTFPGAEGKWQVSTNGGAWPRWSRAGDEIIYRQSSGAGGAIFSVSVQTDPSVRLGTPERLFGSDELSTVDFGSGYAAYEPTSDPDQLIMLEFAGDRSQNVVRLVYLENWMESYRRTID
jgi:serine/threonine-protein kinase